MCFPDEGGYVQGDAECMACPWMYSCRKTQKEIDKHVDDQARKEEPWLTSWVPSPR